MRNSIAMRRITMSHCKDIISETPFGLELKNVAIDEFQVSDEHSYELLSEMVFGQTRLNDLPDIGMQIPISDKPFK
jgi:hypothetical protein